MSEPGDCQTCKSWKDCIQDYVWFHYGQIRFCVYQIIWILTHAEVLRTGRWPKAEDSSSDNNSGQRAVKTEGSFVKPEIILAEVEQRLERTGGQAELLITQIEDGRTFSTLSNGAMEVLMYVKGKDRKRTGFKKWLREVYYQPRTGEKDQFMAIK